MQSRNDELYSACREYVDLALSKVRQAMPNVCDLLRELDRPVAHLMLARYHGHFYSRILTRTIPSLCGTPQRQRVVEAIKADHNVNRLVDRMVGTPGMQVRVTLDQIVDAVLFMYPASLPDYSFDQALFDTAYDAFERAYYATEAEISLVMPFYGMRAPEEPIELTTDVQIRTLKETECPWFLRDQHMIGPGHGLAAKLRVPVPIPSEVWEKRERQTDSIEDQMKDLCKALAVFKRGNCAVLGTLKTSESPLLGHVSMTYPEHAMRTPVLAEYQVLPVEVGDLKQFCLAALSKPVVENKAVQVAMRRFLDLVHRTNIEDRLVDLVIGAEALFLSDQGDRSELRYRFALRAAAFLSSWHESPKTVFELFRQAYDLRSSIVHGGDFAKFQKKVNLAKFSEEFEDVLRLALKRVVAELSSGSNPLKEWDGLIERRLTHERPST